MSTEAQRRAAARKAKILARGNAGLQKLAQTARGEEAQKLYGDEYESTPTSSRPETPTPKIAPASTTAPTTSANATTPPVTSTPSANPTGGAAAPPWAGRAPGQGPGMPAGMPSEAEMQAALRSMGMDPEMLARLTGGAGSRPGAGGDPFAALMGPGGNDSSGGPNPFAGGQSPFGGQDPFAALMDPANAGANPFANFPGMAGMPGMPGAAVAPSKGARWMPVLHALCVFAFTLFVAAWWEPTVRYVRTGGEAAPWAIRWGALGGRAGQFAAKSVIEPMPVFYAFVTLEAILLATRVTLVKSPPALHPLLANVLPLLPPGIQRLVSTGSKYLGVAGQTYRDACLFVFGLGVAIVVAEYWSSR